MLQNRLAMCLSLGLCQSVGARSLYKIAICLCILDSVLLTGNCIDESSWLLKHSFIYKVMSSFCLSFSSIAWRRLLHQNNKKSIPKRSKFGALLPISKRTILIFPTTYFYWFISHIIFCNRSLIRLLGCCLFPEFWGFVVYWGGGGGGGRKPPHLIFQKKGGGRFLKIMSEI